MQFNLSDKEEIQSYLFNKIFMHGESGDMSISIFISEGFVYDVSFHIGAYTIGQIYAYGMDYVFNIIYDSICKKICNILENDLNIRMPMKN